MSTLTLENSAFGFFPKSKFEGVETSTPSITFSWILAEVKINGSRLDLIFLPFSCFHSSLKNARTSRLIWIRFHKSTNPQHKMTQLISSDMFWIRLMLFWSPLAHSLLVSLSLSHHFIILLYRAHFWKILWKYLDLSLLPCLCRLPVMLASPAAVL